MPADNVLQIGPESAGIDCTVEPPAFQPEEVDNE